jgi:type IV pilus assembly protein PilV
MLGLVGLQMTATRSNQSAYHRSQAALLAQDALERIRLNVGQAESGGYDIAFADSAPGAPNCVGASQNCNPAQLRSFDLARWLARIADELPSGDGEISVSVDTSVSPAAYSVTVSVRWFDPIEATTLQYDLDSRL